MNYIVEKFIDAIAKALMIIGALLFFLNLAVIFDEDVWYINLYIAVFSFLVFALGIFIYYIPEINKMHKNKNKDDKCTNEDCNEKYDIKPLSDFEICYAQLVKKYGIKPDEVVKLIDEVKKEQEMNERW